MSQFTHKMEEALDLGQEMLMGEHFLNLSTGEGAWRTDSLASGVIAYSTVQGIQEDSNLSL